MKRLIIILLIISISTPAYAQDAWRDQKGNYVLTQESFTKLWANYQFYKRELDSEKKLNYRLRISLEDSNAVIKGLRENNKALIDQNKKLVEINNSTYNKYDVILIASASAIIGGVLVFILAK